MGFLRSYRDQGMPPSVQQKPEGQDILSRCIMTECPQAEHETSPLVPVLPHTLAPTLMMRLLLLSGMHHAKNQEQVERNLYNDITSGFGIGIYDEHLSSYQSRCGMDKHTVCRMLCWGCTLSVPSTAIHAVCFAYRCEYRTERDDACNFCCRPHDMEYPRCADYWTLCSFIQQHKAVTALLHLTEGVLTCIAAMSTTPIDILQKRSGYLLGSFSLPVFFC